MKFPEFRQKHVNFVIISAVIVAAAGVWANSYWQAQTDHIIEALLAGNPVDTGNASTMEMLQAIMKKLEVSASSIPGVDATLFADFFTGGGAGIIGPVFVPPTLDFAGPARDLISFTQLVVPTDVTGTNVCSGGAFAAETLVIAQQPANNETVVINGKTYTFQTTLTNGDGNVLIVGTTASRDNLVAAINIGVGAGTLYALSTTLHPTVTASAVPASNNMVATAKCPGTAGNSIALNETLGGDSQWTGGAINLSGGTNTANAFGPLNVIAVTCDGAATPGCEDLTPANQTPPILDAFLDPFDIEGLFIKTPASQTTVKTIFIRIGFCFDNDGDRVCDNDPQMDQVGGEIVVTMGGNHTEFVLFPFGAIPPQANVLVVAQIKDTVGGETDTMWLKLTRFGQTSALQFFYNPGLDPDDFTCLEFQVLDSGVGFNGAQVFILGETFGFGGFAVTSANGGAPDGTVAFDDIPADFYLIDIEDPADSTKKTTNDLPLDPSLKVVAGENFADEFLTGGEGTRQCVVGPDADIS